MKNRHLFFMNVVKYECIGFCTIDESSRNYNVVGAADPKNCRICLMLKCTYGNGRHWCIAIGERKIYSIHSSRPVMIYGSHLDPISRRYLARKLRGLALPC